MANDTSGHESEFINVQDLKASLQKFKTDKVDVKVDKVTGKELSTNDFTTAEKTKLSNAVTGPASSTDAHVAVFDGATGKIVKDSGFTIAKSVPSNAVFTDTTYSSEAAASEGTAVSLCTTGEKYTWNNKLSASSFTNNNKGTSVGKIMVADASNGLGYSTPSDLASVLDVKQYSAGRLIMFSDNNTKLNCRNTVRSIEIGSFTKTSSASGNVGNVWDKEVMVVGARCTSRNDTIVLPYTNDGKTWWFHCTSDGASPTVIANTSLTIKVALFDLTT